MEEIRLVKKWNVETSKIIIINPEKIKFDPGEIIKFTGTATPNIPLELILEDSLGDEMSIRYFTSFRFRNNKV